MIRGIKVQVTVTKTMWVYEDEFNEEGFGPALEFNDQSAIMFAKATLMEEMQNDPSRGSGKVLAYGKFRLKKD